jgi:predicted esterase
MARELSVETPTHGRVLVRAGTAGGRRLVGFHGYGQPAERMLSELEQIPGTDADWLVAAQGLHRFYTRGDETVIASWMTRQDRETTIADNVEYVDRVVRAVDAEAGPDVVDGPLLFIGFSQGAGMAYRAARLGRHRADGVIALGGDIPPELKASTDRPAARPWPPVLIGVGARDWYYTPAKVAVDVAFLATHGIDHEVVPFVGGHEWTEDFRTAVGAWIMRPRAVRRPA